MQKDAVLSANGQARLNSRRSRATLRTACGLVEMLEGRRILAAPVAANDSELPHFTDEDAPLEVDAAEGVLVNDTDADGDALTAVKVTDPAHGTLVLNADGSYRYTPAANFFGFDTFTYKASDGAGESNVATVTIGVNNVNDAPVAAEDSYSTARDQTLSVNRANGLLKNDTDPDLVSGNPAGETLSAVTEFFEFEDLPDHGTLTLNADGSFTYAPATGYVGTDAFVYFAVDGSGQGHGTTVNLNITASSTQQPPAAVGDGYAVEEDTPITVIASEGVLANDSDANGDAIVAILFSQPRHGAVTLNRDGSFVYTPAANFSGTDFFEYRARDGNGAYSNHVTATLTVAPGNDAPTLSSPTVQRQPGQPVNVQVLSLADDPDEDEKLTFEVLTQPASGEVQVNDNATPDDPHDDFVVYTPDAGTDPQTDSFTVRITDEAGESVEGTITITATTQPPAGGGSATLAMNPLNSSRQDLLVQGTGGNDVISVIDKGGGSYEVVINGASKGTFSPTGSILVNALGGNDRVSAAGVGRSVLLYGGLGNDTLRGGAGADLLLGGGGKDRLEAGSGRNIYVGGAGRDRLSAASASSILIGGRCAYENPGSNAHRRNLERILGAWTEDAFFSARVRAVRRGVGPTRATFSDVAVFDDGEKDTVIHQAGPDWIFRSKRDVIEGAITSDRVQSI